MLSDGDKERITALIQGMDLWEQMCVVRALPSEVVGVGYMERLFGKDQFYMTKHVDGGDDNGGNKS